MKTTDCKFLGTLAKPHGYKGDMVLFADSDLPEEIENWESVFVEIDGLLVPFLFASINLTHSDSALVRFQDYENVDLIGELLHCKVYAPLKLFRRNRKRPSFEFSDLEGYEVIDVHHGNIGKVEEIMDYNQNLVFRILKGKKEILIPVQDSIIDKIDSSNKTVFINAPEGLIDLYLAE